METTESKKSANEDRNEDIDKLGDVSTDASVADSTMQSSDNGEKVADTKNSNNVQVPRTVTLFGGISFIVGTIIGAGIFISPRSVAIGSGSVGMTLISWVICGIISIFGAFCYAELGTVVKESGSDYIYLHVTYGSVVSYIYSWVNCILVKPASLAIMAMTSAQYIMVLLFADDCGDAPVLIKKLLAIFLIFLLFAINISSSRLAARIQIICTVVKLFALAIIIIGGLVMLGKGNTQYLETGFEGTETNPGTIAVGLYGGLAAYDGWNTANFITEELINPQRNLPLSILIGVPLCMVVYVLTNLSYFTVMSIDELIASPAVGVTWAERVIPQVVWLIPLFVAVSTFGTGNGIAFSSGRLVQVAARNDHLPSFLTMVHYRNATPVPAVALLAVMGIVFVIPGSIYALLDFNTFLQWLFYGLNILAAIMGIVFVIPGSIYALLDFNTFLQWLFYGLNMLAVIILRFNKNYKNADRPVRTPLIIIIIAFVSSIFLVFVPLITDPRIEFLYAVILIAIGFVFWLPFVFFKVQLRLMEHVTIFFQLYTQSVRPRLTNTD